MLSSDEIKTIIKVFEPYNPVKIGLFGSTARNEETEQSDVDILYELKNSISLFTIAGIQIELEEKLKRKVDIVSVGSLYPELEPNIMADFKLLYAAA